MTFVFTLETLESFFLKNEQAQFINSQAAVHALREVCPSNCSVFTEDRKIKIWIDSQNAWLLPEEVKALAKNIYEDRNYSPRLYYKRGPKTLFDIATNW